MNGMPEWARLLGEFAWVALQWVILLGLPALFVFVLFPMYVRWATITP